ncbi:MAG: germination protein YpeB [Clostridia bacterium]|nr:germination protein YpeB [Clostridia bacterium]
MGKRGKIRAASFIFAVVGVLTLWGSMQALQRNRYEQQVITAQRRAIAQLCEYFDAMQTDLQKSGYANTVPMFAEIASDLEKNASGAKTALGTLDSGQTVLSNIYMYLSQAGAFTGSLGRKLSTGEQLTEEDRAHLQNLAQYAQILHDKFLYMNDLMESGAFSFDEVDGELGSTEMTRAVNYLSAAAGAEESFADYPTLLYDGPFSDGVLQKESALLANEKEITLTEAKQLAAKVLGADNANQVIEDGENAGRIATYNFYYEGSETQITKKGGYVKILLNDSFAGEIVYSGEDAVAIAQKFLQQCGYEDMVSSYFATNDGICTVNFAFMQDDYICYPDLIKVSVSLSDGKVLSMDASSYIMNHSQRQIPSFAVRLADAAKKLNPALYIRQVRQCVVPTAGGGESFAYEFLVTDNGNHDALVYIDAQTGMEDEIFLLLYADGGTLTK